MKVRGGGLVPDMGYHSAYLCEELGGEIIDSACVELADDNAALFFIHQNGAESKAYLSWRADRDADTVTVVTDLARITLDCHSNVIVVHDDARRSRRFDGGIACAYRRMFSSWGDGLRTGTRDERIGFARAARTWRAIDFESMG